MLQCCIVYNKAYSKEIHSGATPFSRVKGVGVFSIATITKFLMEARALKRLELEGGLSLKEART